MKRSNRSRFRVDRPPGAEFTSSAVRAGRSRVHWSPRLRSRCRPHQSSELPKPGTRVDFSTCAARALQRLSHNTESTPGPTPPAFRRGIWRGPLPGRRAVGQSVSLTKLRSRGVGRTISENWLIRAGCGHQTTRRRGAPIGLGAKSNSVYALRRRFRVCPT